MSEYDTAWSVECPRCSELNRSEDHRCKACNEGQINASVSGKQLRSVFFGCSACGEPQAYLKCKECGADIREAVTKELGVSRAIPLGCMLPGLLVASAGSQVVYWNIWGL